MIAPLVTEGWCIGILLSSCGGIEIRFVLCETFLEVRIFYSLSDSMRYVSLRIYPCLNAFVNLIVILKESYFPESGQSRNTKRSARHRSLMQSMRQSRARFPRMARFWSAAPRCHACVSHARFDWSHPHSIPSDRTGLNGFSRERSRVECSKNYAIEYQPYSIFYASFDRIVARDRCFNHSCHRFPEIIQLNRNPY